MIQINLAFIIPKLHLIGHHTKSTTLNYERQAISESFHREDEGTKQSLNIDSFISGFVSAQGLPLPLCQQLQKPSKPAVMCTVVPFSFDYSLCLCVCVCFAIHCVCCV